MAGVVGERHPNLDGCPRVGVHQLVACAGGAVDFGVIANPLVVERRVGQAVGVGDARRVRRQRLAHLGRAADGRGARRCPVWPGRDLGRRRAGERLGMPGVVGERHPNLDGCARVGVRQPVRRAGRAVDAGVIANPHVVERRVGEAIGIRKARCVDA